ncbi:MAG: VOC family protein [Spirochaetes bacterium]|nr:VOC family protein [Spirochaetota bacterium]
MIHGLQHIGIGFKDINRAWDFYKKVLHFDVPLSRSQRTAERMGKLTGGPQERQVVIALNLLGGALVEIFQFLSKEPLPAPDFNYGDLGILSIALKVKDINKAYSDLKESGTRIINPPESRGTLPEQLFFYDPEGNLLSLIRLPDTEFSLSEKNSNIGGILFPTVGVSDMEKSLHFYRDILGFDTVVYDYKGEDKRLTGIPGAGGTLRRILLKMNRKPTSLFSFYLKGGMIELVHADKGRHIHRYRKRGWGDSGIMELCFDVNDIEATYRQLVRSGAGPVIEANTDKFDMGGGSSAFFAYVSDPDGTWVELAEITSFPIWGRLNFDLKKRPKNKPLSPLLMKLLRFAKEK